MVKSHGVGPPPVDITKYLEPENHQRNGASNYSEGNDEKDLLVVKQSGGADCVDGEMVRYSARQMSVDPAAHTTPECFSTWYDGARLSLPGSEDENGIDTQRVQSFPDRGGFTEKILLNIIDEETIDGNAGDDVHTKNEDNLTSTTSEVKEDEVVNKNDDVIIPETTIALNASLAPVAEAVDKSAPLGCTVSDGNHGYDEVDALVFNGTPSDKLKNASQVKDWLPNFTILDIFFAVLGIVFFMLDIVSDWGLAIKYYNDDELEMFYMTLGIIVVPAVISAIISLTWSCMDYGTLKDTSGSTEQLDDSSNKNASCEMALLVLKVIFSILQLGRCFRSVVYLYFVIKSFRTLSERRGRQYKKQAMEQKNDSAILGLVDGFLESALQLLLQLYLSISRHIYMDYIRIVTICLSLISTALLHTSYYRNNRKVQKEKRNVGYTGALFYFLWRLCELGPRFILIVLFCYAVPLYIPLTAAFVHFIFMAIFYIVQKPTLKGICCSEKSGYPFLLLISYIGIFCYVNLQKNQTKLYVCIYYAVFYLENIGMFVVVACLFPTLTPDLVVWKDSSYIIFPGFVCQVVFQTLYYKCFHPKNYGKSDENSSSIENEDDNCYRCLKGRCNRLTSHICGINLA